MQAPLRVASTPTRQPLNFKMQRLGRQLNPNPLPEAFFCSVPLRSFGAVTPGCAHTSFTNLVGLTVFLRTRLRVLAYREGIEPSLAVLETAVLPLDDRYIC